MTPTRILQPLRMLRRPVMIALLAPPALALCASQAKADGESISMVQNDPAAVVGQAVNFTASGSLNPDDTMFGFDIIIFVKNADADPTCAADYATESAAAMNSGGTESYVSPPGGFEVGTGPSFSQPFKITFTGGGDYLLCGYVQSDFSTVAAGQLRGVVTAPPSPTPPTGPGATPPTGPGTNPTGPGTTPAASPPALLRAPWITRSGRVLTCHGGSWSNSPTSLRYRWYVRARARSVGSGRTLTVRRSLSGRHVRCRVTAHNAAGARTATTRSVTAR